MDERLYNADVKEQFLATYDNEGTQTTLRYLFYKSAPMEEILERDLYDFDLGQLIKVIKNTDPLNLQVAKSNSRFLSNFIDWSIETRRRGNVDNPLKAVDDELLQATVSEKKLYISENELLKLESKLVNYQDKVILQMLFEGAQGYHMNELVNLREQDINFETGELKLTDPEFEGRVRDTLKVSKHCLDLIKGALAEKEYANKNGTSTRGKDMPLVENDYVIRPIARKVKDPNAKADKHTIYRRLTVISELFEMPYLTAKSVSKSGMLKISKDLYLRDGELEKDQIYEVADRFGLRKLKQGEHEFHNRTAIEAYINRQNILDLYGIDILK